MTDKPRITLEGKSIGEFFEQAIENKKLKDKLYAKEQECEELKGKNNYSPKVLKQCPHYKNDNVCTYLGYETKCEGDCNYTAFQDFIAEIDDLKNVNSKLQQQLDQLKSEKDELKKVNNHIENNRKQKADKLMRIEKLIIACSTGYTDEFIQELLVILHEPEPSSFENKYKTILAEIKKIAERCGKRIPLFEIDEIAEDLQQILQKISECEGMEDV